MSKAHVAVSVYALLLLGLEIVEVSETRIKANAFLVYVQIISVYTIGIWLLLVKFRGKYTKRLRYIRKCRRKLGLGLVSSVFPDFVHGF